MRDFEEEFLIGPSTDVFLQYCLPFFGLRCSQRYFPPPEQLTYIQIIYIHKKENMSNEINDNRGMAYKEQTCVELPQFQVNTRIKVTKQI